MEKYRFTTATVDALGKQAAKQLLMWKYTEAAFVTHQTANPAPPEYGRSIMISAPWVREPAGSQQAQGAAGLANARSRRDGAGEQTEEDIDYMIDIGIFTRDLDGPIEGSDHVLYMEKHRVNETTMRFELIVDEEPVFVGVDPYNKLIDRDSDDNLSRVTIE